MYKKLLVVLMTLVITISPILASTDVYAATTLSNSTGSTSADKAKGVDSTSGKKTEYSTATIKDTTYTASDKVTVYATKSSWVTISVPKTLILGPSSDSDSKYVCSFKISVSGDLAGAQSVTISVPATSNVTEKHGKGTLTGKVLIDGVNEITINAADLVGKSKEITGTFEVSGVSAGEWDSGITFGVVLNYSVPRA